LLPLGLLAQRNGFSESSSLAQHFVETNRQAGHSGMQGMQLMDTALLRLVDAKLIAGDQAYLHGKNKAQFAHLQDAIEIADEPSIA